MRYPNGFFGWIDLMSTDIDVAKEFYRGLFGWELEDRAVGDAYTYTTAWLDGKRVAGLGPLPPGATGVPSVWTSYVMVDDVDGTVGQVVAAGGSVVLPAMDIMTEGRQAMVADPGGAVVGLWQPGDHDGADIFNAPGALTWNELQTRDLDRAVPFYESVFGWRWDDSMGGGYLVAHLDAKGGDDTSNAGAMPMPDAAPAEAPNWWAVYFAVADCDESLARATELGASVWLPAMEMGPGRFAGVSDPTGAMFLFGSFGAQQP